MFHFMKIISYDTPQFVQFRLSPLLQPFFQCLQKKQVTDIRCTIEKLAFTTNDFQSWLSKEKSFGLWERSMTKVKICKSLPNCEPRNALKYQLTSRLGDQFTKNVATFQISWQYCRRCNIRLFAIAKSSIHGTILQKRKIYIYEEYISCLNPANESCFLTSR